MFSNAVLKPKERRPWFLRCCSQFKIVYYILWGTIVWVHSKTNAKAVLVCSLVFPQRWQTPSFAAFFCQTSLMCNDLKYFVLKKSDDCANDPVPQRVVSFRLHLLTPLYKYELRHISRINILSRTHFQLYFFIKINNLVRIHISGVTKCVTKFLTLSKSRHCELVSIVSKLLSIWNKG